MCASTVSHRALQRQGLQRSQAACCAPHADYTACAGISVSDTCISDRPIPDHPALIPGLEADDLLHMQPTDCTTKKLITLIITT
jgi:hypothetical protein